MASSDINSVTLVGRLTRDADLRYTQGGMAVASLSVAVNRSRKDNDQWISEANFFEISYFGKAAESTKPYLTKGKQIAIQGYLKQDRWEKEGQKFSKVTIVANSLELLGGRSDGGSSGGYGAPEDSNGGYQQRSGYNQRSSNAPYNAQQNSPADSFGGDSGEFPEDIPF